MVLLLESADKMEGRLLDIDTAILPAEIHAGHGPVCMDIVLYLRPPENSPVRRLVPVEDRTPGSKPDRKNDLLPKYTQIPIMEDVGMRPVMHLVERGDTVHPRLGIGYHRSRKQELPQLGSCKDVLLHQHLDAGGRRQVAILVVGSFAQDQMDLFERVHHGETIGHHGRIVILFIELDTQVQQGVERLDELAAAVRGTQTADCFALQRDAIMMVVFIGAASYRQPVLLILDISP